MKLPLNKKWFHGIVIKVNETTTVTDSLLTPLLLVLVGLLLLMGIMLLEFLHIKQVFKDYLDDPNNLIKNSMHNKLF